eukprot:4655330-Ditylum_brightwellii.AAC.1
MSVFNPEFGASSVGNKCHQLYYIIESLNCAASRTFELCPNTTFNEGGVEPQSQFCCVCQYKKDKPDKLCIDFFVLADGNYYSIQHTDVYQGRNASNIDIHPQVPNLPTTLKATVNACYQSQMENNPNGAQMLYADNYY